MENNKKRLAIIIASVLGAALIAAGIFALVQIMNENRKKEDAVKTSSLFYDSLENAARQQQLKVAMYRSTFSNKADADARKNVGSEASSVAEVDTTIGKMRAVYASNVIKPSEFVIGRCLDGTTYIDDYQDKRLPRPASLADANAALKTNEHVVRVTEALVFIPCPNLGLLGGGSVDLASFRFSDGVFPVTLNEQQAKKWKEKVQAANLLTVVDEGMVTYDGKQLRKISFVGKNAAGINRQLDTIFKDAGEIEKIKAENPNAVWQYEFLPINPLATGSLAGFYLIDEQTRLPVYSELSGINEDKSASENSTARLNIARTKQTYTFGQPLSLTLQSQLEQLP
jgi:hypothetical protein